MSNTEMQARLAEAAAKFQESLIQAQADWEARKLVKRNPAIEAALKAEEMQIAASESKGN